MVRGGLGCRKRSARPSPQASALPSVHAVGELAEPLVPVPSLPPHRSTRDPVLLIRLLTAPPTRLQVLSRQGWVLFSKAPLFLLPTCPPAHAHAPCCGYDSVWDTVA